jgi:ABC-type multidrug transport system fused ATPase/permease subunit
MLRRSWTTAPPSARVNNHVPETDPQHPHHPCAARERYMERRYDRLHQARATAPPIRSNVYDSLYSPIVIFSALRHLGDDGRRRHGRRHAQLFRSSASARQWRSSPMSARSFGPAGEHRHGDPEHPVRRGGRPPDQTNFWTSRSAERAGFAPGEIPAGRPAAELDRVDFGYGSDGDVLRELSFRVEKGERVTLTGRTGRGARAPCCGCFWGSTSRARAA